MQKTKKSIKKRFKITASGKVLRRTPGRRHQLRVKTTKQKRSSSNDKPASNSATNIVKKACPFSF
jgi:large subunit ribosomal protein L35